MGDVVALPLLNPHERICVHAFDRYRERIDPCAGRAETIAAIWTSAVRRAVLETAGRDMRVLVRCGAASAVVVSGFVVTVFAARRGMVHQHSDAPEGRRRVSTRERRPNGWKQRALRELVSEGVL